MIRAAFLTMGLYLSLCGTGLLAVDEVILSERVSNADSPVVQRLTEITASGLRKFHPPEWMAFTCIGVGGVTMLYAVALPKPQPRRS